VIAEHRPVHHRRHLALAASLEAAGAFDCLEFGVGEVHPETVAPGTGRTANAAADAVWQLPERVNRKCLHDIQPSHVAENRENRRDQCHQLDDAPNDPSEPRVFDS
jgi:hypothetical protein